MFLYVQQRSHYKKYCRELKTVLCIVFLFVSTIITDTKILTKSVCNYLKKVPVDTFFLYSNNPICKVTQEELNYLFLVVYWKHIDDLEKLYSHVTYLIKLETKLLFEIRFQFLNCIAVRRQILLMNKCLLRRLLSISAGIPPIHFNISSWHAIYCRKYLINEAQL